MTDVVSSRGDAGPARPPGRGWASQGRLSLMGLGAVALMMALIVTATLDTGMYYLTVDEFHSRQARLDGQRVRINGEVMADSESWDPRRTRLEFQLRDADGEHALAVVYIGPRPDNFQRAASAIVEGSLAPSGEFVADSLLLKCPSRYEEEASLTAA